MKIGVPPNRINSLMNKFMRESVNSTIKFLYPKLYQIDNLESDQSDIIKGQKLKSEQILKNIGMINTNGMITMPYMFCLSFDDINSDSKLKL